MPASSLTSTERRMMPTHASLNASSPAKYAAALEVWAHGDHESNIALGPSRAPARKTRRHEPAESRGLSPHRGSARRDGALARQRLARPRDHAAFID
jgi:hypothetical protein